MKNWKDGLGVKEWNVLAMAKIKSLRQLEDYYAKGNYLSMLRGFGKITEENVIHWALKQKINLRKYLPVHETPVRIEKSHTDIVVGLEGGGSMVLKSYKANPYYIKRILDSVFER